MPFRIGELQVAYLAYKQFLTQNPRPHHSRYIFPFFCGTYFAYRWVDVMRTVAIARSFATDNPSYLDVGCGYGDFLDKVREHVPGAMGIESEGAIFYAFGKEKPFYIELGTVEYYRRPVDVAFVGWMEPGVDFRRTVASLASCVITTFDAGGQCGINGGCEYEEFGFEKIAWWRTPSWIDVNTELMNRFYTGSLNEEKKQQLSKLRTAHNFWYVYARPSVSKTITAGLKSRLEVEQEKKDKKVNGQKNKHGQSSMEVLDRYYDFESVLDECGFHYKEELPISSDSGRLWDVRFE